MNTKNKIRITLLTLAMSVGCIGTTFVGSLAYYQDNVNASSNLTVGFVDVELHEEFPEHDEFGANTTTKKFWGENIGNMNEYVRASIITNVEIKNDDGTWAVLTAVASDEVKYTVSDATKTNWIYSSTDDYWYFSKPIAPGELTTKFDISNVHVDIPDEFKSSTLRINMTVSLESCQASHNQYKLVWQLDSLPTGVK